MLKRYRYRIAAAYDQPELRQQLKKISLDQDLVYTPLKQDKTTTVRRFVYRSQSLVVKRYNTQSIWHAIRRSIRQSRAENCWKMTRKFEQAGILVAPRVAIIQESLGPFKLRSWFVCEYVEGEMLAHYFSDEKGSSSQIIAQELLANSIRQLFKQLQQACLTHGDLKATNILLTKNTLCLIDLDAARAHQNVLSFQRAHKKDQARFMKNWQHQVDTCHFIEPLIR